MAQSVAAISTVSSFNLASPISLKPCERLALGLPKLAPFRSTKSSKASSSKLTVVASAKKNDSIYQVFEDEATQSVAASTIAGSLFALLGNVGSAAAAEEVMQLAEGDSRGFLLLFVLLPALGWVLFNVAKPALNQFNKMTGAKPVAGAVGLGALASLLAAPEAEAAQEVAQLAADSRPLILAIVLLPALGWVLFNIAKPALNQINKMLGGGPTTGKKRGVIGAIGLGAASLIASDSANAAQEVALVAADNRPLILAFVLLPALGWVLFNVAKPTLNQVNKMIAPDAGSKKKK